MLTYEREREELVDKLTEKGITDIYVIKAMREVERHKFVPLAMLHNAYKDIALPIGYSQTISQPYTVAYMTQALRLRKKSKVLEIGTGSGYQAAILEKMGMEVFSIERNMDLYIKTRKLFDDMRLRINTKCGDGTIGWEELAPFDGVIVTAGSPSIPDTLMRQLAVGGRLVIPVGDKHSQILKIVTKLESDNFNIEDVPEFSFVPLIGREGWSQK